ncbi:uncharacterized protein LOC107854440 isoform X1 [Capsicum annuum]|uniref:uncharacterized protein LOC107854440 isoform X1 n=1 Tax=Capsicum annuum TaxID=4072 RepID=UPI001FB0D0CD|nr:uncharacterized protein LOC107854440 isoform X1 [Capsicum annuum]
MCYNCKEDLIKSEKYRSFALIGFVVGDTPYMKIMENYVQNFWKTEKISQIMYHDEGYFVFRFESVKDSEEILFGGPYTFQNKPFILQRWELNFEFNPDCITNIPLWITMPGLPVGYWSTESLSKLASAVGRSLHTDSFTTSMERISYARILIEMDVSQPLIEEIDLATPYGEFQQIVEYDWIPKFCKHCMKFGHNSKDCWNGSEEGDEELEFKEMRRKKQWNRGRIKLPL